MKSFDVELIYFHFLQDQTLDLIIHTFSCRDLFKKKTRGCSQT